jgi:hypothetical protein
MEDADLQKLKKGVLQTCTNISHSLHAILRIICRFILHQFFLIP